MHPILVKPLGREPVCPRSLPPRLPLPGDPAAWRAHDLPTALPWALPQARNPTSHWGCRRLLAAPPASMAPPSVPNPTAEDLLETRLSPTQAPTLLIPLGVKAHPQTPGASVFAPAPSLEVRTLTEPPSFAVPHRAATWGHCTATPPQPPGPWTLRCGSGHTGTPVTACRLPAQALFSGPPSQPPCIKGQPHLISWQCHTQDALEALQVGTVEDQLLPGRRVPGLGSHPSPGAQEGSWHMV